MHLKQNINHVDHIVWVSRPETMAENVRKLSALTRCEMHGPFDRTDQGLRVCVSFTGGVEIVAPIDGIDTVMTRFLRDFLDKRDEGLMFCIFGVPDIMEAREHAASLGYVPGPLLQSVGGEPWAHELAKFKESVICEFMNSYFVYGEIDYPDGVFITTMAEYLAQKEKAGAEVA